MMTGSASSRLARIERDIGAIRSPAQVNASRLDVVDMAVAMDLSVAGFVYGEDGAFLSAEAADEAVETAWWAACGDGKSAWFTREPGTAEQIFDDDSIPARIKALQDRNRRSYFGDDGFVDLSRVCGEPSPDPGSDAPESIGG